MIVDQKMDITPSSTQFLRKGQRAIQMPHAARMRTLYAEDEHKVIASSVVNQVLSAWLASASARRKSSSVSTVRRKPGAVFAVETSSSPIRKSSGRSIKYSLTCSR